MRILRRGRIVIYLVIWAFAIATAQNPFLPFALTFPIAIVILYAVSKINSDAFVAEDMIWFCSILFFVVGPIQSISNGQFFLEEGRFSIQYKMSELLTAAGIALISLGSFLLGRKLINKNFSNRKLFWTGTPMGFGFRLFIAASICFVMHIVLSGGFGNVLSPRFQKSHEESNFLGVLFLAMLVAFNCINVMGLGKAIRSKLPLLEAIPKLFWVTLGLSLLAVCVNPVNQSRFVIVGSWLPVVMSFTRMGFSYKVIYPVVVAGIVVVMPILSMTTREGADGASKLADTGYAQDVFRIKDVDSFNTLTHINHVVEMYGRTNGENLSAIVLFFVPRKIWHDKPILGGLIVGNDLHENYGAGTANLSFFMGGDLYMDFGWLGVILGAIAIGSIWEILNRRVVKVDGFNVVQIALIGSIPILMRGPVGAVVGFPLCLLCSFYAIALGLKFASHFFGCTEEQARAKGIRKKYRRSIKIFR